MLEYIALLCIELAWNLLSLHYGVGRLPMCCNDPGCDGDETDPGLYSEDTGCVLFG